MVLTRLPTTASRWRPSPEPDRARLVRPFTAEQQRMVNTLKSRFKESRFNEIPRFIEQLPAPLNYFNIVNSIRFSEQYWSDGPCSLNRDLPLKVARTCMSVKSMQKLL